MKLIVTGATGFVGTEVIRLALRNKTITSVVALARKPIEVPNEVGTDADRSKLQSIVLDDWVKPYSDSVKEHLRGADACIWNLAVTPTKSKERDFADVTRICFDYTINGLHNMFAVANKPFRFVYTSGIAVERDQTKSLESMGDYRLMRGRVENAILDFAKQNESAIQITITRPGGIEGPDRPRNDNLSSVIGQFGHPPWVHVSELAATMIDQCLHGTTKETLWSEDIAEIGSRVLRKEEYAGYEVGGV